MARASLPTLVGCLEGVGLERTHREHLTEERGGKNTQLPPPDPLRQSIYSCLAGYEDPNEVERCWQERAGMG